MSPSLVRALASLRARPAATLISALGMVLVGAMIGAAVTTAGGLSGGFDRAQAAARTPEVTARFDVVERATAEERVAALPNLSDHAFRLVLRPVDLYIPGDDGRPHFASADVNGITPGRESDGLAIVAGRPLSGAPNEAVVERGLMDEWGAHVGSQIFMRTRDERRNWSGRIVGIAVEPDNVAYPLAADPRIYLAYDELRESLYEGTAEEPVNAAYLRIVNVDLLPVTLVQARLQSFGLSSLAYTTRGGVRALVDQASGLVVALLVSFALIALGAAAAMLAVAGHARVTRELANVGTLRALGTTPAGVGATYAIEAMVVAAPAIAIGIVAGGLAVSAPTSRLLYALNELPPPHTFGAGHLLAGLAALVVAGLAAGIPALSAARRPVVETLAGARLTRPRRVRVVGRPAMLGARLAIGRPGRLAVGALGLAAAVATAFLMIALANFLLSAQREPAALGERYSVLADGPPGALEIVRGTPGVRIAVPRLDVGAVDIFTLGQPFTLVAFGDGGERVFSGRPIIEGRRARAAGEVEVGQGLARSLGLEVGGRLLAQLRGGGELRLRVSAIVQELSSDGRIGYLDLPTLAGGAPDAVARIAVQAEPGVSAGTLRRRLRERGVEADEAAGLVPPGSSFLGSVVALLRAVAAVNGLVCIALVALSLVILARERAETIAVLRASGATDRDVTAVLAGAAIPLLVVAVPLGYVLERAVLAPTLSRAVARYGSLPLTPTGRDVVVIGLGTAIAALVAAAGASLRYSRVSVVQALRGD